MSHGSMKTVPILVAVLLATAPLGACRERKAAPKQEEHKPADGHDHGSSTSKKEEHKPGDGHDHGSATPK